MPELPEVHTVAGDIKKAVQGYKITKVDIDPQYNKITDKEYFKTNVLNRIVTGVKRVAKNIVIELDNEKYIGIHLAMTGRVLIKDPKDKAPLWVKVLFHMEKDGEKKIVIFTDVRMFGHVELMNEEELKKLHNKYGPEPIDTKVTAEEFYNRIKTKRSPIKKVLLDQAIVSGLGNIYATDAMFLAKIHPETIASKLTLEEATILFEAARKVLNEGIEHRGSTLGDRMYVDAFGKEGSHQNHFRIYSKSKCPECNTKVSFTRINGRGTYFCPNCQVKK